MGSYKGDIQATRFTTSTSTAVVAPPVRLRGIIIASNGSGVGIVRLTTTSQAGSNLFTADIPNGDVINFSFPEDGILFPKGIFVSTLTNVAAVTLLTDKFSGSGLTA
jgi:hypothetical protein